MKIKAMTLDMIACAISILALLSTFKSCSLAKQSNITANQALEESRKTFAIQNRPILTITPLASAEDANRYFDIESISETSLWFVMRFKIENIGPTPAAEIHALQDSEILLSGEAIPNQRFPLSFGTVSPVTLAPGEKWVVRNKHSFQQVSGSPDTQSFLTPFTNNEIRVESEIGLTYQSPGLEQPCFTTRVRHVYLDGGLSLTKSQY